MCIRDSSYTGSGADRQLAAFLPGPAGGSEGDGILFQKISEAPGGRRRKNGIFKKKGEHRSFYKQTHSGSKNTHFQDVYKRQL